jgi:hypothetical protein
MVPFDYTDTKQIKSTEAIAPGIAAMLSNFCNCRSKINPYMPFKEQPN